MSTEAWQGNTNKDEHKRTQYIWGGKHNVVWMIEKSKWNFRKCINGESSCTERFGKVLYPSRTQMEVYKISKLLIKKYSRGWINSKMNKAKRQISELKDQAQKFFLSEF